ncbi:hypothetical protein NN3_10480 [Nocardia neocaledoniensis NBRC 108232]|uniref:Uncharacterized protein n=1 Tax=Nocardia neocaledoniensis TaxID=236511 RepID=A0A317NEY2_9NOCA|nr:hypothetical protein [Nocardia neocaledoniensis]PWV73483.1 hypothetical protein DFR69_107110 [Nocardia neocaledoniensis]GEM30041.1 hypothetical protein NN3_10480 [Nocardia neocaledoniensis NBRC 108232]
MTSPQWRRRSEANLDSGVEALVREVMGAVDDLRTARIQLDNLDVDALMTEPTMVDAEFMSALAAADQASPALVAFAARVREGDCTWGEIEFTAGTVPPEVFELKNSPQFVWQWASPAPPEPPSVPRTKLEPDAVGPSDWPDDFDEYPDGGRSWLV